MNIEIYYFPGTGNSLAVAREISEKTNGKLITHPCSYGSRTHNI